MVAGRPKKEINWDLVELYIKSGATQQQICRHLRVCPETLVDKVKEKYGVKFSEFSEGLRSEGQILIVAQQFQKAMKGYWPALLWLGKVLAGQKEPDNIQLLAANQGAIDQSHRIMELEHKLAQLTGENGIRRQSSEPDSVGEEYNNKPQTESELLRGDTPV